MLTEIAVNIILSTKVGNDIKKNALKIFEEIKYIYLFIIMTILANCMNIFY